VQERSADIYKKNLLVEIEAEKIQFALVKNLLSELKIRFGENNKLAKVAKLKMEEK